MLKILEGEKADSLSAHRRKAIYRKGGIIPDAFCCFAGFADALLVIDFSLALEVTVLRVR